MKISLKKLIITVLVLALVLFAAACAAFFYYTSKLNIEVFDSEESDGIFTLMKDESEDDGVTNILVIGADNDVGSGMESLGNADGLVIVSINNSTKQITLTSLMRDIRVIMSNGYATKLTISYHKGGPELLIECIESNIGIDIDNYVVLKYPDVVAIVDAAGGVEMEVNEDEIRHMREKIEAVSKTVGVYWDYYMLPEGQPGTYTLNGVQAAAFMRVRAAGNGDYERTERARRVLMGLKDNVSEMNLIQLGNFANVVLPRITTDIEQNEIAKHLVNLGKYMKYDIVSNRIPVDDSYYYTNDENAYTVIKFDVNREHFYNTVYTEQQRAKLLTEESEED